MRTAFATAVFMLCNGAFAATASWTGVLLSEDDGWLYDYVVRGYNIAADIHGETGGTWIHSNFFGRMESGGFRLQHKDYSMVMDPTFNWWVLACYGDVVGTDTFDSMNHIDTYVGDPFSGGTLIENPGDFYMAFKASEVIFVSGVGYEEGESWYGWVHVSVDDELNMTLLGEGINLYGGPVVVGAVPEPSAAMLVMLGFSALALRRRRTKAALEPGCPKSTDMDS